MINTALNRLSAQPQAWNVLRSIAENGFRGEREVIARELDPWRDVGQRRFLDFGCGTGEFADCFPADYYLGMDPAAQYIQYAQQARTGRYSVMDGTALAIRDASFDAALVLGVFHHLPDAMVRDATYELHRALKPGATLLVMEDVEPPPGSWNLPGRMMHLLDRGGYIRDDDAYRMLLQDWFSVKQAYDMRSGICDYRVYVLRRNQQ